MLWVLYVACSILAPTTGVKVSPKCYPAIMHPAKIKDLNWCRFVITVLIEAANSNSFKACMPFLMVSISFYQHDFLLENNICCFQVTANVNFTFPNMQIRYIDSVETQDITIQKGVPRICAWDNKSVALAIEQDTNPDGSFGRLPVSSKFYITTSIFPCYFLYIFGVIFFVLLHVQYNTHHFSCVF